MEVQLITSHEIDLAAHYQGDAGALDVIEADVIAYLEGVRAGVPISASALMHSVAGVGFTPDYKQFGRALYNLRRRDTFARYWRRGTRKTLGGNLRIEYMGQRP